MEKFTILVVDDEPANIFLLEEVLYNYNVVSVKNGMEMFDVLEKTLPDLMLLDIMMPGIDGLTLARQFMIYSPGMGERSLFLSLTGY